jgi:hypothetical protein
MDAAEYRAKARELREKARTTHDQEVRGNLLTIADQYVCLPSTPKMMTANPKNVAQKKSPAGCGASRQVRDKPAQSQCAPQRNKKSPAGEGRTRDGDPRHCAIEGTLASVQPMSE